jgi:ATP-dependent DNA ligase
MKAKIKAGFIPPMLLLRTERLPEGPNWLYELKLDGYRALAIKSGGKVNCAHAMTRISKRDIQVT